MKEVSLLTVILSISLFLVIGCSTGQPATDSNDTLNWVKEGERVDWKGKIENGEVGFWDSSKEKLVNIDSPPEVQGENNSFTSMMELTDSCMDYISQTGGRMQIKIEFLIAEDGKLSNFYLLKSEGPCDLMVKKNFEKLSKLSFLISPGLREGEKVPTLAHLLVGIHTKKRKVVRELYYPAKLEMPS